MTTSGARRDGSHLPESLTKPICTEQSIAWSTGRKKTERFPRRQWIVSDTFSVWTSVPTISRNAASAPARDRELGVVQPVSRASEPKCYGDLQLLKCTINIGQSIRRNDGHKLPTDAIYLTKAHLGCVCVCVIPTSEGRAPVRTPSH